MRSTAARLLFSALAATLLLDGGVRAGAPDRPRGFDHLWHQGKISVAAQPAIPCTRCHRLDARALVRARPDHASCFGACHGPPPAARAPGRPYPVSDDIRRVCEICHAPLAIERVIAGRGGRLSAIGPPFVADRDHGLSLSHRLHAAATAGKRGCATCHPVPPAPRKTKAGAKAGAKAPVKKFGPPHTRCIGCHLAPDTAVGAKIPAMTECARCHVSEVGPRARPFLSRGLYPVGQTFSHPAHQARGIRECTACHGAIAGADGNELASPSMETCGSCHDGKKSFSIVGTSCRRCHIERATIAEARPRAMNRYDHGEHAQHLGDMPCARCHKLDKKGAPLPPASGHAPCADAGCHRDDFLSRAPKTCGGCHVGIEPWRKLHYDAVIRPDTEFGAVFSHRAHIVDCKKAGGCAGACESCHRADRGMRAARDHRSCVGSGCHLSRGGPGPAMIQCERCHQRDLEARIQAQRLDKPWSVRARFRHGPHETDPRTGAALRCDACHSDIERSTAMADIPTPAKATCLPCHNGTIAFKATGHSCARCHARTRAPRP